MNAGPTVAVHLGLFQRQQRWIGLLGWSFLTLPTVRDHLQAHMWSHMMLQLPALAICGALMVGAQTSARAHEQSWNAHGMTGLSLCAVVLTLSMVPRVLDMTVTEPGWNACKFMGCTLMGVSWRLSWQQAGLTLQGFFLGNALPMMAVVGYLYQNTPLRVCNVYGLDDQQRTGFLLNITVVVVAAVWLWHATRLIQLDDDAEAM